MIIATNVTKKFGKLIALDNVSLTCNSGQAISLMGPNGSGKTSITSKILQHEWVESCLYINPDNIANEKFGDWNLREAVLDAAKYSTKIREECIEKGEGLIFETVLSADDKINFILRAKQKGI